MAIREHRDVTVRYGRSEGHRPSSRPGRVRSARGAAPSCEALETRQNLSAFAEPVMLSSAGGVLDVTLRAHRSSQLIEVANPADLTAPGVPTLVDGFDTYAWTLTQGTSDNGQVNGDGYNGPTLRVNPGDLLRIRVANDLGDQPTNLHTHGLIISPAGNTDNVLLSIPPGESSLQEYRIPLDQEPGINWYHPHRHEFAADQVYRGLAGFLVVGAANNDIDQVSGLPQRLMMVQAQSIEADSATGRPTLAPLSVVMSPTFQVTINGRYMPEIAMQAETELWYGLQLDVRDLMRTFIPPAGQPSSEWDFNGNAVDPDKPANLETFYVAQDGSAFPKTVAKQRVALAPGKRVSEVISAPPAGEERLLVAAVVQPTALEVTRYQAIARMTGFGAGGDPQDWVNRTLTSPSMQYEDLSKEKVDVHRTFTFSTDPVTGQFVIDGKAWPGSPIAQPRVGQVEEWTIVNTDPYPHPIHLHMQHFQAQDTAGRPGYVTPPHLFDQDVWYMDPNSISVFRIKFEATLGNSVFHCHNFFHEDAGMMAHLNVIPAEPILIAAEGPSGGRAAVYAMGDDDALPSTPTRILTPFGRRYRGGMTTATGDTNFDGVPDAIFASGRGGRVVVLDGASNFATVLRDFHPFGRKFRHRLNVAAGDLNGDGRADVIVTGAGGTAPVVRAYSGATGNLLAEFLAFDEQFRGGVSLAAADVDGSGRNRIVTGRADGQPEVRVWGWDLFVPNNEPARSASLLGPPRLVADFLAGPPGARGGIAVATTTFAGAAGGFARIATVGLRGTPQVDVWMLDPAGHGQGHAASTPAPASHSHALPAEHATAESAAQKLTSFAPYGRRRLGTGPSLASVNTTTGSLLAVAPRGQRNADVRVFQAVGATTDAVLSASLRPPTRRGGFSLGGS
ncbi:multicopper oxidase domain-containing protein [Singulisphaera sp. Ch08]|uniref:Multicopper oxidase domain-containing protein n=1 Tax=Singulisphaera sp. Ch08 TaxID=3120278 RepID=A0AAU7C6M2_9BACT